MAIRYLIIERDARIVHFLNSGQSDVALCGQDLAGDSELGWEAAEQTKEKVNCKDCIRIVEHCKKIKRSEWRS